MFRAMTFREGRIYCENELRENYNNTTLKATTLSFSFGRTREGLFISKSILRGREISILVITNANILTMASQYFSIHASQNIRDKYYPVEI